MRGLHTFLLSALLLVLSAAEVPPAFQYLVEKRQLSHNTSLSLIQDLSTNVKIYSNVAPASSDACYTIIDPSDARVKTQFAVRNSNLYLQIHATGDRLVHGVQGFAEVARRFGRRLRRVIRRNHDRDEIDSILNLYGDDQEEIRLNSSPESLYGNIPIGIGQELLEAAHTARRVHGDNAHFTFGVHHDHNDERFAWLSTTVYGSGGRVEDDSDGETLVGDDGSLSIVCPK